MMKSNLIKPEPANRHKTVSAKSYGIVVCYTDTSKHYKIGYESDYDTLSDLQLNGNKFKGESYQNIGTNQAQQKVYRTALYGLTVFTTEELATMSFLQKSKIISNQKKVQRFLDKWKQEICNRKIGSFITKFLKKTDSIVTKDLFKFATYDYYDENNKNKMDFKDLGINRDMIVQKLILAKLLPHNYYELK